MLMDCLSVRIDNRSIVGIQNVNVLRVSSALL